VTKHQRTHRNLRVGSLVLFCAGWELLGRALSSMFVPSFLDTAGALVQIVSTRPFWQAIWISHQAFLLGFAGAVVVGTALGFAMGRWRAVEGLCDPYVHLLLATPIAAVIPVIILAVGLGLIARALVVFLFAVAVIVVNTRAGLKTIEPAWIDMARGFGAGGIGRMILDYQGMFAADLLYATVAFVTGEAVLLLGIVRWLERRITPWNDQVTVE
jgi:ABC-type nitrate/sulfonate/bicarbonate transport system permease component